MPGLSPSPPNTLLPGIRAALVESHRGFALKLARRFIGCGLPWEDLESAALHGLVKAARHYRPELGYAFTTYSFQWVRQYVQRDIRRYLRGGFKLIPVTEKNARRRLRSLYRREDEYSPADDLAARTPPPWARMAGEDDWQALVRVLHVRQRRAIERRYRDGWTLDEVARELGISRQGVQQLVECALLRLKRAVVQGRVPVG